MKLATLKDGSRDGRLVVVSRDLRRAAPAIDIAPTLLRAIEHWPETQPRLTVRYEALTADCADGAFDFDAAQAMSPLPRTFQFLDGSTFANHGGLIEKAFDLGITNEYIKYPLVYQGAAKTPFLKFGERVKIEMLDASGRSIFGAIDQRYVPHRPAGAAP